MDSSDFFQYGRSYALYMQGMTDVGRQASKDLEGNEVDAPEYILNPTAVDRHTLLIAKSIGSDLTLAEFKNVRDSVEFLHRQYAERKITNAIFQEKLWAIPDRVTADRKSAPKPHYKPSRDKKGRPVAKQPDAGSVPLEVMQQPAPGMLDALEPIDFKQFWQEVVAEANGVDPSSLGSSSAVPPGHGSVPVMAGAPPVIGRGGGDSSGPDAGGSPLGGGRGGFVDQIQAGLDAIGILEPTPFADTLNAGISAIRALRDPENAGTHLKNAGISLVSAFVPYVGDAAKLGKYGLHARNSRAGQVAAGLFGGLGGHAGGGWGTGGSGGGGQVPPGGGHGGGVGGSGAGGMLQNIAGGFGNLAQAMGPVGFALAGASLGVKKFIDWLGKVDDASQKLINNNRALAQFDGGLAGSYARLDNERLLRQMDRAHELAGPMGRLTQNQSEYEAAKENLLLPFTKLATELQAIKTQIATYAIMFIDSIEPISEIIEWWYGESKDANQAKNVVDFMARQANERMAKRKL
jgi:hypothetical protein